MNLFNVFIYLENGLQVANECQMVKEEDQPNLPPIQDNLNMPPLLLLLDPWIICLRRG